MLSYMHVMELNPSKLEIIVAQTQPTLDNDESCMLR